MTESRKPACGFLLGTFAFGHVFGEAHQILRFAFRVQDRHFERVEEADAFVPRVNGFLGRVHQPAAAQRFPVLLGEESASSLGKTS